MQAIATRIVGSPIDADDVLQDTWLRLARVDFASIDNLAGWLTVVVSRIWLDHIRARRNRREDPIDTLAGVTRPSASSIESAVVFEESVYEALAHALDRLSPMEAAAFILHDLFQVPFDEIAAIFDRTPVSTRKLASRARLKISNPPAFEPPDLDSNREIVDAFMRAARTGDLSTLLALLAPNATLRADRATIQMGGVQEQHGANAVAGWFDGKARVARIAWFDGIPGAVWAPGQHVRVAFTFTIRDRKIQHILLRSDPAWLEMTDIELEPRPRRKNARG